MINQIEPQIIKTSSIITNPVLREDGIVYNQAILIKNGKIEAIGDFSKLSLHNSNAHVIDAEHCIALPGFIDAHNHGQGITTLCHGTRDDFLELWVHNWPGRQTRSPELIYWDALYAISRQLKNGITTSMRHDSPRTPSEKFMSEAKTIIQAYSDAGIRFIYALGTLDKISWVYGDMSGFLSSLPDSLLHEVMLKDNAVKRITVNEFFDCFLELHKLYENKELFNLFFGSMGPQWVSDHFLERIRDQARVFKTGIHGPLLETKYQKEFSYREFGLSAIEFFDQLGLLSPNFSLAHGIWMNKKDIEIISERGVSVVHAPSSNLRLFSGIAPINFMRNLGVNIALCVDSEGINENDDMFQEMRLAMVLHRLPGNEFIAPDAWEVLAMATVNGAQAVLLSDRIGTLEEGKEADLILINENKLNENLVQDSISLIEKLIYYGNPSCIDLVMVSGRTIFKDGDFIIPNLSSSKNRLRDILQRDGNQETIQVPSLQEKIKPYIRQFYSEWTIEPTNPFYRYNAIN